MSKQRHTEINAIGGPNTSDRNVHARGAQGRVVVRHVRGASANTHIAVTNMAGTDELLYVLATGTSAPSTGGGDSVTAATDFSVAQSSGTWGISSPTDTSSNRLVVVFRRDPPTP